MLNAVFLSFVGYKYCFSLCFLLTHKALGRPRCVRHCSDLNLNEMAKMFQQEVIIAAIANPILGLVFVSVSVTSNRVSKLACQLQY